eukprot:92550-Prymnesium_polylepis.2
MVPANLLASSGADGICCRRPTPRATSGACVLCVAGRSASHNAPRSPAAACLDGPFCAFCAGVSEDSLASRNA